MVNNSIIRRNVRWLVRPALIILFVGLVGIVLQATCKNPDEKRMNYLNNEIVNIDINGHFFNVPLNYAYGETLEKWGNWPKTAKERVIVDYLHVSMLFAVSI
ncbi:MAG: hypothetical protein ABL933_02885 [Methyloglobulus sp.]|nr:hypothetical protein [Methyloglobulus sp.]